VFYTKDIEAAIEKGRKYNPDAICSSENDSQNDVLCTIMSEIRGCTCTIRSSLYRNNIINIIYPF
jgi:hypothetical protein